MLFFVFKRYNDSILKIHKFMKLLFGKPVADEILNRLKSDISLHVDVPGLAVLLIGDDGASQVYVSLKEKKAREIGMNFFRFDFSENASQEEIVELIEKLNGDSLVHGIIVQLPLPEGFNTAKIISSIEPKKDADGFHPVNTELFVNGGDGVCPVFPRAISLLMKSTKEELSGKKAVVLANSQEFGTIMNIMLSRENIDPQYVLAENIPSNLEQIKDADIVVSAMGSPGLVGGEMLKNGAIVIDGGIEKVGETVVGDVDFASTEQKNGYITPVPGGVGPLTIACLLENTYLAFKAQQKGK